MSTTLLKVQSSNDIKIMKSLPITCGSVCRVASDNGVKTSSVVNCPCFGKRLFICRLLCFVLVYPKIP